jgi:hypothetical protein
VLREGGAAPVHDDHHPTPHGSQIELPTVLVLEGSAGQDGRLAVGRCGLEEWQDHG